MSDNRFALLWSKILKSSVWSHTPAIRIVWITLLAEKNNHGVIFATKDSLRRSADVPIEDVEKAIQIFSSPDPDSATDDGDDGTRIRKVNGGWEIINHDKYKFSGGDKGTVWREAQARRRAKLKGQAIPESSLPSDASEALRSDASQEWRVRYEVSAPAEKYEPPLLPRPASLMTPKPELESSERSIFRTPSDDPDNEERFAVRQGLRAATLLHENQHRAKRGLPPIETQELPRDDSEAARAAQRAHEADLMENNFVRDLREPAEVQAQLLSPERQKLKDQFEQAIKRNRKDPSDFSYLAFLDHGANPVNY